MQYVGFIVECPNPDSTGFNNYFGPFATEEQANAALKSLEIPGRVCRLVTGF